MNTALIIAGLLFFVNPNISIFDPLPDFIGAILIAFGIYRLSKIDERCADAFRKLLIIIGVAFAQTLSNLLYFVIDDAESTWYLVLTMCFGAAQAVLFAIFFKKLADGVSYRAMCADASELYDFSSASVTTIIFCVFKAVFTTAPELAFLTSDFGAVESFEIDREFLYGALTVLNVVTVTALGVFWFIKVRKYLKTAEKSEKFREYVAITYKREYSDNYPRVAYDRVKLSAILFCAAVVFALPARFSGIDFLPDFVCATAMALALASLYKFYAPLCRKAFIFTLVYFVLSGAEWGCSTAFACRNADLLDASVSYSDMIYAAFLHEPKQYTLFILLIVLFALKTIAFALALWQIGRVTARVIDEHTGVAPEVHTERTEKKNEKMHRDKKAFLSVSFSLLAACAVFDCVAFALSVEAPKLWALDFTAMSAAVIASIVFFEGLKDGIRNKYFYL